MRQREAEEQTRMGLAIDIMVEHDAWTSLDDIDSLARRAVDAAVAEAGASANDSEVCLVLCDDAFMQSLNRTWRAKDKPTNVLSFPADSSAQGAMLGDIVVAYQTMSREAAEEGKAIEDHLAHLVVHGMLHLLGYDHETETEAATMEDLEVRSLRRLGIRSPYEDVGMSRAQP